MKIDKSTIIRTIILFVSLINIVLEMLGKSIIPVDSELVSEAVSLGILFYGAISSWWHNNSFTKAAVQADELLKQLKEEE